MSVKIYDSTIGAFKDAETPLIWDEQAQAWKDSVGLVWNEQAQAWEERWGGTKYTWDDIESVSWNVSHSGNGDSVRGYYPENKDSNGKVTPEHYLFASKGKLTGTEYYSHSFSTGIIPCKAGMILKYNAYINTSSNYYPTGTCNIYDKDRKQLRSYNFNLTYASSGNAELNIPTDGYSISFSCRVPGNWGCYFLIFNTK